MKNKLWLVSLPIIIVSALFQVTFDWGEQGKLRSKFFREEIYPFARIANGMMTNIKFKLRGPEAPNPSVVIVTADDKSVENLGRWPWHREIFANLVHSMFKMGAKNVGIDIVYSEAEERIPKEVYDVLAKTSKELEAQVKAIEGDPLFADVMKVYSKNLVLGYNITPCQPLYDGTGCPVDNEGANKNIEESIGKFAFPQTNHFTLEQLKNSPMLNTLDGLFPIKMFHDAAENAGYFYVTPDPDGFIRRYPFLSIHENKVFYSLAAKMAELALDDHLVVEFDDETRVNKAYFSKTPDQTIPLTKLGYMDLNFKGPHETFPYISAFDVMLAAEGTDPAVTEKVSKALAGKNVFLGVSAIGIFDMRAFPFDSDTAGVEGHATALSNLIDRDPLRSASGIKLDWLPLTLIVVIGLTFAILFSHLEAVPGLILFAASVLGLGFLDIHYLFSKHINLPTMFIYSESFFIFALTLSIRYVLEERNKKQIKGAFSHYLAPQVVEMVLKDSSKLVVGGERRDLAIMFSDIRGFTTLSENLDPKTLSQFLNEYLSAMTDIVFETEGTLDKYIGDAVMAFWGAPLHQDDYILRACTAAIKMRNKLKEMAPDLKARYGVDVSAGLGVNAGTVSVGNMGSSKIFEYTVIGDSVNLASRLEGLTRHYGVDLISTKITMDTLYEKYPDKIFYRILDTVKVKGKKNNTELVEIDLVPFDAEAVDLFEKGRVLFAAMKWDEAKSNFEKSAELYKKTRTGEDPVCELFIERCIYFKETPPPAGWDGSTEMRSK